jgi:hypothetical protein
VKPEWPKWEYTVLAVKSTLLLFSELNGKFRPGTLTKCNKVLSETYLNVLRCGRAVDVKRGSRRTRLRSLVPDWSLVEVPRSFAFGAAASTQQRLVLCRQPSGGDARYAPEVADTSSDVSDDPRNIQIPR